MEAKAIQTKSVVGLTPQHGMNPVPPGQGISGVGRLDTSQKSSATPPDAEPPVDKVQVSVAARALAEEIAEDRPRLQLSPDRLRIFATGDADVEG